MDRKNTRTMMYILKTFSLLRYDAVPNGQRTSHNT